ncbi:MAG: PQQ-dependent dehydrogenase, methanol/ethanol family [Alphaproteobacteria bacterium]|nr:PQQ-dependent dehydrogenase, methanol/ethanol family [Alphaproteobacteria bacterium]
MSKRHRLALFVGAGALGSLLAGAAVAQKPLPPLPQPQGPPPVPAILQNYKPVTAQGLTKPGDGDWLMYRRTYDGWGYSPLTQITPANVGRLKMVWTLETGQVEGHEAPPIVNNGVMFVATPGNQVLAIDAKSGDLLWRYKRPIPEDMLLLHPTSRGVGIYGDKVYFAANDAVLVALNAKTGKEAWKTKVEDYTHGYYMTLSPLIADGKVMVGVSGGELGIRGFVAAFDAETGKPLWKTYTVPAPGEPGSETWPKGNQWKTGGGAVWIMGTYDPTTNLAYWGTGNGGPWMGDQRPGDNLYTASVVALDANTGAIKGHFQYHPNESWDWDEVSPPILVDYRHNGKTVHGLVDVARDGYLWELARVDGGKIEFVAGEPFVKQNVFKSLDPETGRPEIDPVRKPGTGKKADFCPSLWGGKDWPPVAYSPKTRLLYIPANENLCGTSIGEKVTYSPGERYVGATTTLYVAPDAKYIGELQAWNLDTGKKVWSHPFANSQLWGPVLATGGGLVFAGGTNDRYFRSFDASNGKALWQFRTGSGVVGVPVSFALGGKQYVAVQSGWGVDSARMQARINLVRPYQFPDVPQGGAIWVFAIE